MWKCHSVVKEMKSSFMFDPDRIEQVLTNLIDNAIRHTPDGGSVMITKSNG